MNQKNCKANALVLLSGGLDSILAARLVIEQGIRVEGIHFTDPFSAGADNAERAAKKLRIKLHSVSRGRELLRILKKPKHGYGSQANPCIDCRIISLKKAWRFARQKGFDLLVTGEVLGQRPMSQKRPELMLIEKEAGLRGKILRPLSARLLPETEAEKKGWIDREKLLDIHGRSRKRQIALAKKYRVKEYPSPAGGCLLTDPGYACRMLDLLKHEKKITEIDAELLKVGRYFRLGKSRIVVGRNESENKRLASLARKTRPRATIMEVMGHMGPTTLVLSSTNAALRTAARLTVRYSDAPKGKLVKIEIKTSRKGLVLEAKALPESRIAKLRV